jgi:hypothetical protein
MARTSGTAPAPIRSSNASCNAVGQAIAFRGPPMTDRGTAQATKADGPRHVAPGDDLSRATAVTGGEASAVSNPLQPNPCGPRRLRGRAHASLCDLPATRGAARDACSGSPHQNKLSVSASRRWILFLRVPSATPRLIVVPEQEISFAFLGFGSATERRCSQGFSTLRTFVTTFVGAGIPPLRISATGNPMPSRSASSGGMCLVPETNSQKLRVWPEPVLWLRLRRAVAHLPGRESPLAYPFPPAGRGGTASSSRVC